MMNSGLSYGFFDSISCLVGLLMFAAFSGAGCFSFRLLKAISVRFPEKKNNIDVCIFFFLFAIALVVFFQANIIHDAFQYYSYLVSMLLDKDLNMYNQVYMNNTHRFYNPFPLHSARYMGTAVMEAPFFMVGHVAAEGLNIGSGFCPQNGYSLPYIVATGLASSFFGMAGLLMCYFLVREFFSRSISLMAVIGVWLASPLLFFMFSWNGWSHPFSFCLTSAFVLSWFRTRGGRSPEQWLCLGLVGGLLGLIRPTAGLVFMLPVGEFVWKIFQNNLKFSKKIIYMGLLLGLCGATALFVFSPQFSLWKVISGKWIATPYAEVGDYITWSAPGLAGLLFSVPRHGLFAWTPLLLPAALGVLLLWRKDRQLSVLSALVIAVTVYLFACWSIWWSGAGFSNRFLTNLIPFFILGFAAVIELCARWIKKEIIWSGICFGILWNVFLIGAYRINMVPQSIPGPFRVVDAPLTMGEIASAVLCRFPAKVGSLLSGTWINENFFFCRLRESLLMGDTSGFIRITAILGSILFAGFLFIKIIYYFAGNRISSKLRRIILVCGAVLVLVLHSAVWIAAGNTIKPGDFYRFPETNVILGAGEEDAYFYSDYPLPVSKVDVLSSLSYGHAVPHGDAVAEVTITSIDGKEWKKKFVCGIDTVETSILRAESSVFMKHNPDQVEIVRSRSSNEYSSSFYETVLCRSVLELPESMIVRRVKIRYLYPFGNLVVSDIFMRDFDE